MAHGTDFYLSLLTSQHREQPQFAAVVEALTEAVANNTDLSIEMANSLFDLDRATGAQLDAIGLWVGITRRVPVPITDAYFTWGGANDRLGWGFGHWKGPFDPTEGIAELDDLTYRSMIRAKIGANMWDGTAEMMYQLWNFIFGVGAILVQDNQDMSITLIYDDLMLSPVQESLLINNAYPLKPAGVQVNYSATTGAPLFAWDRNLPKLQGWGGTAVWASS